MISAWSARAGEPDADKPSEEFAADDRGMAEDDLSLTSRSLFLGRSISPKTFKPHFRHCRRMFT